MTFSQNTDTTKSMTRRELTKRYVRWRRAEALMVGRGAMKDATGEVRCMERFLWPACVDLYAAGAEVGIVVRRPGWAPIHWHWRSWCALYKNAYPLSLLDPFGFHWRHK